MNYIAPVKEMTFTLEALCDLTTLQNLPGLADFTLETMGVILEEAGRFASEVLAPLNVIGDQKGAQCLDGLVTTAPGWQPAYRQLVEAGWNSPAAETKEGGMGLPHLLNSCIQEMFHGANMAFQLCPMLTQGAIEAISGFASEELRSLYLSRMISGIWSGTMNLTEPQAGSDLAAIRSRAEPRDDHYLIYGQKIFITYGDHDLAENIIHLVLARLPDAPAGIKGISLFIVPKFLLDSECNPGIRNDVACVSIEHKLGIHASPTCTLAFGEAGGAVGYLVGEKHRGVEYMFIMMNNARLNVGIQGVGVAERATQQATAFALSRAQGRPAAEGNGNTIIAHADVRRMIGEMRARTDASRGICTLAAVALDFAARSEDAAQQAYYQRRADFLIPIAKAWSTEGAVLTASQNVQVHGGIGYIEETGAAQHYRDARITTIYEGTTGIQSLDLVGRKMLRDNGLAFSELINELRGSSAEMSDDLRSASDHAADLLVKSRDWLLNAPTATALASATHVQDLVGICLGAWVLAREAAYAERLLQTAGSNPFLQAKRAVAQFYFAQVFPMANARFQMITRGVSSLIDLSADDISALR